MLTDRFTARVLGGVVVVMTLLIDVSCFMYASPEVRHKTTFPLVLIVPSLPLFALAAWLFRRASHLREDDD